MIIQSLKRLKEEYKTQVFDKNNWRISNDLKNIYADIYLGYKNALEKDTTLTDKTVYINEILCMKKEDIPYLKYLYLFLSVNVY